MNNVFPGAVLHPTSYYGYPNVGSSRRIRPTVLAVIHTTETYGVPMPSATKSWTFSVERDGTVHQFMDPVIAAAWTNGDLRSPDIANPLIAAMVGSPYNANEFCFLTIENVNRIADGQRLTDAQLAADAAIVAWASKLSGLPVDRTHVIGHYQINGETRVNCPTVPTDRPRVFGGVVGAPPTLPDAAMEFHMILRRVHEQWTTGSGPDEGAFFIDGPGVGEPKYFTAPTKVWSFAEEAVRLADGSLGTGKWRLVEYGGEVLFMHREMLTPVPGTRDPASGFGLPAPQVVTVTTGITQAQLDAANALLAAERAKSAQLASRITAIKSKIAMVAADVSDD